MRTTLRRAASTFLLAAPLSLAGLYAGLVRPHTAFAAELSEHAIGAPDAPVTVIEYASLTCHHCATFQAETLPELKKRYIDTGKVRLVFRDFPLNEEALKAAKVAHCAGPERHAAFVDVFLRQHDSWAQARDTTAALKQLAKLGGLGEQAVDACLADKALEDAILSARLEGQQKYGVKSTPTFVIGGRIYSGNKSIEEFAAILDPLLG
jgi:protein-disulfide isomerase